jgi:hypothetical protein
MDIKLLLRILRWLFIGTLLSWGAIPGVAQNKSAQLNKQATQPPATQVKRWHGGQKTITDAAGRKHVRSERITYAQRKAAAQQRVKAMREAAAKKKLAEVKQ